MSVSRSAIQYLPFFVILSSAQYVHAASYNVGNLSVDNATNIITDTLTNRQYLKWDVVEKVNYASLTAATSTGGALQGWSIANNIVADAFIRGIFGANPCDTASNWSVACGSFANTATDAIPLAPFGDTYTLGTYPNNDYVFYLNKSNTGRQVGLLGAWTENGTTKINQEDSWGDISSADWYAFDKTYPIGWLLYRDGATVPEPASITLLASGLLGYRFARRKSTQA